MSKACFRFTIAVSLCAARLCNPQVAPQNDLYTYRSSIDSGRHRAPPCSSFAKLDDISDDRMQKPSTPGALDDADRADSLLAEAAVSSAEAAGEPGRGDGAAGAGALDDAPQAQVHPVLVNVYTRTEAQFTVVILRKDTKHVDCCSTLRQRLYSRA